jgi:hypothetical protein
MTCRDRHDPGGGLAGVQMLNVGEAFVLMTP